MAKVKKKERKAVIEYGKRKIKSRIYKSKH